MGRHPQRTESQSMGLGEACRARKKILADSARPAPPPTLQPDWKVVKVEESNGQQRQVILVLNEESGTNPEFAPDLEPPETTSMGIKPAIL
ncbi:GL24800 [Drosophila persimilis]|uniref:GL24800 n=1 Tax=Drosophila persimilis TaxID=7234 RepID=B4HCZ4_DROPE|nr:GL24800 [Drosophila persimilis]